MFTGKKHLSFYSTKTYNVKALVLLVLLVNLTNAIYHPGVVSSACMRCICKQESSCRPLDCKIDSGSLSCGYFQIKKAYYEDCGRPGKDWPTCSKDIKCASQCVQNYMRRYGSATGTCQDYARIHNGGPRGNRRGYTLAYWNRLTRRHGCTIEI